jgi:hypothetical protein
LTDSEAMADAEPDVAEVITTRAASFLPWLERTGSGAIPKPVQLDAEDEAALGLARARVLGVIAEAGLLPMLHAVRAEIADWVDACIANAGFKRYLFGGRSLDPRERLRSIEILEDLALAFIVFDRDDDAFDRLVGRWEVGVNHRLTRPGEEAAG